MTMRKRYGVCGLGFVLLVSASAARAGCVGAAVMGKCEGYDVPWDTHEPGEQHPDPPAGFRWDWRMTPEQDRHPFALNPETGRDAHDSHWSDPEIRDSGEHHGIPNIWIYTPERGSE